MGQAARLHAGDGAPTAHLGGDAPVQRHGPLQVHPGAATPEGGHEAIEKSLGFGREVGHRAHHLDAGGLQGLGTGTALLRVRIERREHDALHARGNQRVGARRCLAMARAGLERDVGGRAARRIACLRERYDLGMRTAVGPMPAFAHDPVRADEDAADRRVGLHSPEPHPGQGHRSLQARAILLRESGHRSSLRAG